MVLIPTRFDFCESIEIQAKEFKYLVGYQHTSGVSLEKKKSVHQGIVIVLLNRERICNKPNPVANEGNHNVNHEGDSNTIVGH